MYENITKKLFEVETVAIFMHINPDGDCIGSSLAMYKYLKNLGITAHVFLEEGYEIRDNLMFLPNIEVINAYSLKKYGITVEDKTELYKFIGPPLHESFEKFYGFSRDEAMQAVEYYREYYRDKGIYENVVYDGVEDLLKTLFENGKKIILATSKPEVFAREILRYFNLEKYFYYSAGANLDGSRTDKAEVIEYALRECGVTDKSSAVMVGDREHDIIGANKNGLDSIGVLFGFGSREELESAGATYIAETVKDILC